MGHGKVEGDAAELVSRSSLPRESSRARLSAVTNFMGSQEHSDLGLNGMSVGLHAVIGGLTVVPPMSTTRAVSLRGDPLAQLANMLAPRIEFVGPEEKVLIGK